METANSINGIKKGLLAWRSESQAEYQARITVYLEQVGALKKQFLLSEKEPQVPSIYMTEAWQCLSTRAGIYPDWSWAIYSRCGMGSLHLGALAVSEPEKIPFIQLHPAWMLKKRRLGYDQSKVLAHELIHLMRHGLDSGKYEEFFAYSLESYAWRRLGGALFSHPLIPMGVMISFSLLTLSLGLFEFTDPLGGGSEAVVALSILGVALSLAFLLGVLSLFAFRKRVWDRYNQLTSSWSHSSSLAFALQLHEEDFEKLTQIEQMHWLGYLAQLPIGAYRDNLLFLLTNRS